MQRHPENLLVCALALVLATAYSAQATPVTSNLSLWLDATDSVTLIDSTYTVVTWSDKSGNGLDATAVGIPTWRRTAMNGHPAIALGYEGDVYAGRDYFTVSESDADGPLDMSTQLHMFIVAKLRANTAYAQQGLLDKGSGGGSDNYIWELGYVGDDDDVPPYNMNVFDGSGWYSSVDDVVPITVPLILEVSYDNSRASDARWLYYVDGVKVGQTSGASPLTAYDYDLFIGCQNGGNNAMAEGSLISELLMYKGALTDEQRNLVGFYLEQKYDLNTVFTPEPATLGLLALGLLALRRR